MRKVKITDFAEVITGGTPSTSVPEYWEDGDIPWLQSGACQNCIISDCGTFITKAGLDNSAAKMMKPDSVLIALTGATTGKVGYLTFDACANQSVTGIQPNERFVSKYLYYYLLGIRQKILDDSYGGAQKHISQGYVKNIEVPLGTIYEQQEKVDRFDRVDKLISLRKQELRALDDIIKARFVEMFGDEKHHLSLQEVCSIITDGTHQPPKFVPAGIPFIFVSNIVGNTITYEAEKYIDQATYDELIRRTPIEIGDILLSTVGSYGHPAVVKSDRKFLFQRHIAYLKPKHNIVNSDYLHGAILSSDAQQQIEEAVKGIAQKTLNLSEIRKITIPVPPLEAQSEFAAFVSQVDKSKVVVQAGLDKAQLLFDSLMQKYFG